MRDRVREITQIVAGKECHGILANKILFIVWRWEGDT